VRQRAAVTTAGREVAATQPGPLRRRGAGLVDSVGRPAATQSEVETANEPQAIADGDDAIAGAEETAGRWDGATRLIAGLILFQFVLTLYLGQLSSWWSLTGVLWLLVIYGVRERLSWSLALPLVLFTLDVAMLLFGVGPRERAGFYSPAPMDFLLLLLRLIIWGLIWRLRDELTWSSDEV
jgi:hypothetical protein